MYRALRQESCQSRCDWAPTATTFDDDLVFACAGCQSEWTRQQGWRPRNLDGRIDPAVIAELERTSESRRG